MPYSLFFALFLALILAACGGDGASGSNPADNTGLSEVSEMVDCVVSSFDDLTADTDVPEGASVYVKDENKAYVYDGDEWVVDAELTDSIQKLQKKNQSNDGSGKNESGKGMGASAGSVYDAENNTLTDLRDGHVYRTVKIGAEIWMAENLNYAYLGKTKKLDSSSFCYNDSLEYCDKYGRLYLWSAAMDSAGLIPGNTASNCGNGNGCEHGYYYGIFRGVCPAGWYLPSMAEWQSLILAVDSNWSMLRATSGWIYDGPSNSTDYVGCRGNGTDDYGFTELPAGKMVDYSMNPYMELGSYTDYWSSSTEPFTSIWRKTGHEQLDHGLSVRCVKDPRATPCKTESGDHCEYGTLKDERDGHTYKTVKIGEQWWMAENLNYAYPGGTSMLDSSSFCYNNDPASCEKFGRFYLRSAAMDSAGIIPGNTANNCGNVTSCSLTGVRGVCPTGWHVPDSTEWVILHKAVQLSNDKIYSQDSAWLSLKSTSGWDDDEYGNNLNGLDSYGFSALAVGYHNGSRYTSMYDVWNAEIQNNPKRVAAFWSSSGRCSPWTYASAFFIFEHEVARIGSIGVEYDEVANVRCIKD